MSPKPTIGKLTIDCTRKALSSTGDTAATPPATPRSEVLQERRATTRSTCSDSVDNDDTDTVICMNKSDGEIDMHTLIRNCAQDVKYISKGIANSTDTMENRANVAMIERWLEKISARLSRVPWHVACTTVLTTAPDRIVVPDIDTSGADCIFSTRDMIKRVDRDIRTRLLRQFSDLSVAEPHAFRVLTSVDRVHLTGKYTRRGPLLWAQTDDDMWVLVRLELWPIHDVGCLSFCCPVCWGDAQGVCDFLEKAEDLTAAAEKQLGLNPYGGYCKLPWCW